MITDFTHYPPIFNDTIEEKPVTDENAIIAWHFDHCQQRTVKGVNSLNCLHVADDVNIPVAFCDVQTRQVKRHSAVTINEQLRQILRVCQHNQLRYRTVLTDSWFSSKENMAFIKVELQGTSKNSTSWDNTPQSHFSF